MSDLKKDIMSVLALFTSTGTLICCALPAAIAAVAGGAAVASLVSAFPFLITLSRFKLYIFIIAGILLILAGYLIYRPSRQQECAYPDGGCEVASRFSRVTFWVSVGIFSIGLFFAYLAVPLMRWLGI